jgi:hypothetical protein
MNQDYQDARRQFWEQAYCASLRRQGALSVAKSYADSALQHWDDYFISGPNGTVVPKVYKK